MCHSARKFADRLNFLRMCQLDLRSFSGCNFLLDTLLQRPGQFAQVILELPALGNVHVDSDQTRRFSRFTNDLSATVNPAHAVRAPNAMLEFPGTASLDDVSQVLFDHRQVIGMHQISPFIDRNRPSPGWLDAVQAALLVRPQIRAAPDIPVVAANMARFLAEAQQ